MICALVNSKAILKNMFRRHTDVYLDVLAVIPPEELAGLKTVDIGNRAHGILLEGLAQAKGRPGCAIKNSETLRFPNFYCLLLVPKRTPTPGGRTFR